MKYYIYKITFDSGHTYIGCHMQKKENDNYICSSVYAKNHKDDKILKREILIYVKDRETMGIMETICIMSDKAYSNLNANGTLGNWYLKYTNRWSRGGKGKKSLKRKKVLCIETKEIFDCILEAEKKYKHSGDVCRGKRKSSCGKHFVFLENKKNNYLEKYKKIILCIEDKIIFKSLEELSMHLKINPQTIKNNIPFEYKKKHYKIISSTEALNYNFFSSKKQNRYNGKIKCLDNNAVFKNIKEAIEFTNISHIADCINGKRITAGGYKWEKTNEKLNSFKFSSKKYSHDTSNYHNYEIKKILA